MISVEAIDAPDPGELFGILRARDGLFFLDSGLHAGGLGAYSFLGFDPFLQFRIAEGEAFIRDRGGEQRLAGDPLLHLRALLKKHRCESHPEIPFVGGAVGAFSYDLGAGWEPAVVDKRSGSAAAKYGPGPQAELRFYDGILAYHHETKRWWAVANARSESSRAKILARLREAVIGTAPTATDRASTVGGEPRPVSPRSHYLTGVEKIKDYIRSGDIYQVNLAHRFEAVWKGEPHTLYRRLRERSPAPFACFVPFADGVAVSCSPERFLQVRGRRVETRPIKGTRPRGRNPAEDERYARELLGSEKERAELLMIVDLERNDLGRVCVPGSIRVEDLYRLEAHPTVYHLVGTVSGMLRPDCDALDLFRASFPGGSITGAPKIRAMQIIDELEAEPRGLYTGSIGYLGFDGSMELNIAIRTIFLQGDRATYHVGAGIVWDSDPESEYEETLAKGRALAAALNDTGDIR